MTRNRGLSDEGSSPEAVVLGRAGGVARVAGYKGLARSTGQLSPERMEYRRLFDTAVSVARLVLLV